VSSPQVLRPRAEPTIQLSAFGMCERLVLKIRDQLVS